MSVLMVMAPPTAAMFFNGTLAQFAAKSSFGTVGRNASGQKLDITQGMYKANGVSVRSESGQESG
ncbi:hypothetical protein [Luteimonas terrae]|uniref:Uncharacterized protein n=1 Tax=Luteimonas terrae TaxID=1530191 RepID=A0ABU1XW01_9GAMM|nr:hypothetical protein [Luteimonas terrae]MDR7192931.1 hypothetical protein [Luteimonas terrae]